MYAFFHNMILGTGENISHYHNVSEEANFQKHNTCDWREALLTCDESAEIALNQPGVTQNDPHLITAIELRAEIPNAYIQNVHHWTGSSCFRIGLD